MKPCIRNRLGRFASHRWVEISGNYYNQVCNRCLTIRKNFYGVLSHVYKDRAPENLAKKDHLFFKLLIKGNNE